MFPGYLINPEDLEFPEAVEKEVYIKDNGTFRKINTKKAIVSKSGRYVYAIVSKNYTLIQHREIFDIVKDITQPIETYVRFSDDGGFMIARFLVEKITINGDNLKFGISVTNSYDKTSGIHIDPFVFRLVCKNGAVLGEAINRISYRHYSTTVEPVTEKITDAIRNTLRSLNLIVQIIRKAMNSEITLVEFIDFVENNIPYIPARNFIYHYLTKHGFENIEDLVKKYRELKQELEEREKVLSKLTDISETVNRWKAYNAITYVLTRLECAGAYDLERLYNVSNKASLLLVI